MVFTFGLGSDQTKILRIGSDHKRLFRIGSGTGDYMGRVTLKIMHRVKSFEVQYLVRRCKEPMRARSAGEKMADYIIMRLLGPPS